MFLCFDGTLLVFWYVLVMVWCFGGGLVVRVACLLGFLLAGLLACFPRQTLEKTTQKIEHIQQICHPVLSVSLDLFW